MNKNVKRVVMGLSMFTVAVAVGHVAHAAPDKVHPGSMCEACNDEFPSFVCGDFLLTEEHFSFNDHCNGSDPSNAVKALGFCPIVTDNQIVDRSNVDRVFVYVKDVNSSGFDFRGRLCVADRWDPTSFVCGGQDKTTGTETKTLKLDPPSGNTHGLNALYAKVEYPPDNAVCDDPDERSHVMQVLARGM